MEATRQPDVNSNMYTVHSRRNPVHFREEEEEEEDFSNEIWTSQINTSVYKLTTFNNQELKLKCAQTVDAAAVCKLEHAQYNKTTCDHVW